MKEWKVSNILGDNCLEGSLNVHEENGWDVYQIQKTKHGYDIIAFKEVK